MWLIYGANGTTGRLLLDIWQKGAPDIPPPLLAGRNSTQIATLSAQYGLPFLVFSLKELDRVTLPSEIRLVANLAGPYAHTASPWVAYCEQKGLAYLDICGEWQTFTSLYAEAKRYREKGLPLITGAGYDTVVGEAALYFFRQRYPEARCLNLAIYARGGFSAGTVRSALTMLIHGYYQWEKGQLQKVAFRPIRRPLLSGKERLFYPATLAELITFPAWNPDIERLSTWVSLPPRYTRWSPLLERVFAWKPFWEGMLRLVEAQRVRLAREMDLSAESYVLVEAEGASERLYVRTPQAYVFTAWTILRTVGLFAEGGAAPGPASAFSRWKERLWDALPGTWTTWQAL